MAEGRDPQEAMGMHTAHPENCSKDPPEGKDHPQKLAPHLAHPPKAVEAVNFAGPDRRSWVWAVKRAGSEVGSCLPC